VGLLVTISNEVVIVGFVGAVMINVGYSNKETHKELIFHTLTSGAEPRINTMSSSN